MAIITTFQFLLIHYMFFFLADAKVSLIHPTRRLKSKISFKSSRKTKLCGEPISSPSSKGKGGGKGMRKMMSKGHGKGKGKGRILCSDQPSIAPSVVSFFPSMFLPTEMVMNNYPSTSPTPLPKATTLKPTLSNVPTKNSSPTSLTSLVPSAEASLEPTLTKILLPTILLPIVENIIPTLTPSNSNTTATPIPSLDQTTDNIIQAMDALKLSDIKNLGEQGNSISRASEYCSSLVNAFLSLYGH